MRGFQDTYSGSLQKSDSGFCDGKLVSVPIW